MSDDGHAPTSSSISTPRPKIAPRKSVVRKSKAERDRIAAEDAQRAAERAEAAERAATSSAAAAVDVRAESRRKGRERLTKETPDTKNADAGRQFVGGVFGAGTGSKPDRRKLGDTGSSELLDGQSRTSSKPSQSQKSNVDVAPGNDIKIRTTEPAIDTGAGLADGERTQKIQGGLDPVEDEEDDADGPTRDIERIWISSDEHSDEEIVSSIKGKNRAKSLKLAKYAVGLRPVRAPRSLVELEKVDAVGAGGNEKIGKAPRTIPDEEESEEVDEMDVDALSAVPTVTSQRLHRRESQILDSKRKPTRRPATRAKESRTGPETAQERAERMRMMEDARKMKDVFVTSPELPARHDTVVDDGIPRTADQLILFQLPPLIPNLSPYGTSAAAEPAIKADPEGPPTALQQPSANGDIAAETKHPLTTRVEGMFTADEAPGVRLPPGRVGKLRVHKSGKVTLDWGGTDMEVRHGTDVDFLQDVVLVETPKMDEDGAERPRAEQIGQAFALGQIQRKMVVIPDWHKLYD